MIGVKTHTQFRMLELGLMLHRVRIVSITEELVAHPVILQPTHMYLKISRGKHRLCSDHNDEPISIAHRRETKTCHCKHRMAHSVAGRGRMNGPRVAVCLVPAGDRSPYRIQRLQCRACSHRVPKAGRLDSRRYRGFRRRNGSRAPQIRISTRRIEDVHNCARSQVLNLEHT